MNCLLFITGPDYVKQRFQEGAEVKENPEDKAQEKPPSPKESPHFYRKGTTPPGTPEKSPKHSPVPSAVPSPEKQVKKQNSITEVSLIQEKKSSVSENVTPVVNKPLHSKVPTTIKHQPKFSPRNNPSSTENGELHDHYHGYYVKTNPTLYPYEVAEEESHDNPSSALVAQKGTPIKPVIQLDAKESLKKSEFAAPKNPTSNIFYSSAEVNSVGTVDRNIKVAI